MALRTFFEAFFLGPNLKLWLSSRLTLEEMSSFWLFDFFVPDSRHIVLDRDRSTKNGTIFSLGMRLADESTHFLPSLKLFRAHLYVPRAKKAPPRPLL